MPHCINEIISGGRVAAACHYAPNGTYIWRFMAALLKPRLAMDTSSSCLHETLLLMHVSRPGGNAQTTSFGAHFRQMYEDVMTVMRVRTFQLIILQVGLLFLCSAHPATCWPCKTGL